MVPPLVWEHRVPKTHPDHLSNRRTLVHHTCVILFHLFIRHVCLRVARDQRPYWNTWISPQILELVLRRSRRFIPLGYMYSCFIPLFPSRVYQCTRPRPTMIPQHPPSYQPRKIRSRTSSGPSRRPSLSSLRSWKNGQPRHRSSSC